jgi:hypothetical protein
MAPTFFHAYPFFDDNRQFFNQGFATLLPAPLRGFGAVAAFYPIEGSRFYVQSGMYTLNSNDTGFTVHDFFTKAEHFYHLDLGLTGLARSPLPLQARGPMDVNNVNISGWYRNAQENGTPEAVGIAVNANYVVRGPTWCSHAGVGATDRSSVGSSQRALAGAHGRLRLTSSGLASPGRVRPSARILPPFLSLASIRCAINLRWRRSTDFT